MRMAVDPWNGAVEAIGGEMEPIDKGIFSRHVADLRALHAEDILIDWIHGIFEDHVKAECTSFADQMDELCSSGDMDQDCIRTMSKILRKFLLILSWAADVIALVTTDASVLSAWRARRRLMLTTRLGMAFNDSTRTFVRRLFTFCFQSFHALRQQQMQGSGSEEGSDVDDETDTTTMLDTPTLEAIVDASRDLHDVVQSLGVFSVVSGPAILQILKGEIEAHVNKKCKDVYDESMLTSLEHWLQHVVFEWLRMVHSDDDAAQAMLTKCTYMLHDAFCLLRIREMFNIIVDYPSSLPAIEDLKRSLELTNRKRHLQDSLRTSLTKRLLHPGASTSDIIDQFISTIKTLKVIDASGAFAAYVCDPVREYLKQRDDTVRCIVTRITDSNSSLFEEFSSGKAVTLEDDDSDYGMDWRPDSIDVDVLRPETDAMGKGATDITSLFVNIYGSKELFVNEYRVLMADRLLEALTYDTDKEFRSVEMLKVLFGEEQLQGCDVMLKDFAESKRVNTRVHELLRERKADSSEPEIPVNAFILSRLFWPNLKAETFTFPKSIEQVLHVYSDKFAVAKPERTLEYKPMLGTVKLELEIGTRTLQFTVSPVLASIIAHFESKDSWTLADLSAEMAIPVDVLQRRIAFWTGHGVLRETGDGSITIVENEEDAQMLDENDGDFEEEPEEEAEEEGETMESLWPYVVGMLTNLGSLPFSRIQGMLKMFAGDVSFEYTEQDLREFLEEKVRADALQCNGGDYKLGASS